MLVQEKDILLIINYVGKKLNITYNNKKIDYSDGYQYQVQILQINLILI